MRLFATGRALRASSARWAIAPSLPQSLTIEGQSYRTDQWTNTPDTILSHIGRRLYLDENHPLAITRQLIESQFPGPAYGNYTEKNPVVSTAQNFDVLGFPLDHPGRSRTDTYYINDKTVLRTHTSAHQQAYFQQINRNENTRPEEVGYTVVADVYRRDAIDRSHYPIFHQMEGAMLWKRPDNEPLKHASQTAATIIEDVKKIPAHDVEVEDPNPTIHAQRNPLQAEYHSEEEVEAIAAHLKRSLERMVIKIFTEASKAAAGSSEQPEPLKVRWVEAYFPFTSPSWELEVFWQGDWLEVLGCGVIKQELLNNSDVPNRVGWAFGIGLERIAMLLFNIPDIRLFWSRDERFLSQFRAGEITRFEPFSKHPACYKDVAFWLPSASVSGGSAAGGAAPVHENDIMEIVRGEAGDLVEDVQLIDEFTHPKTHRKSMCYRINYRSLERTLTNEETNDLHEKVRQKLLEASHPPKAANAPAPAKKVHYPFWFGGSASCFAAAVTHPLDLVKTRGPGAPSTMVGTFVHVFKNDGFFGLYSGLSAAILRQLTYSTTRFGIYEELKNHFTSPDSPPGLFTLIGMASASGFIGGMAGNPADVLNVRMQSDAALPPAQRRNYRNAIHGLVTMTRTEGPASLFRGVWPNSTRAVLMTTSQLASYDTFKRLCLEKLGMSDNMGTHFTASFMAGFVATTVCSPVDVIKTRVMSASPAEGRSQSIVGLLRDITRKEGLAWAFRGWVPSFIRLGPHTIATFIFLEEHKKLYRLLKGL
ncbi:putative phenylalanyl-tRNA synthetase alpha subunit [Aspergillus costaricaensis CBS 115574]|uniref:Phenylalanyl-tRNA synthetase alpha subunit n=1 Tax=Aspergillus costaricaensis CBS 115574 TaxID=1448317 RepID=A0ACD1I6C3_9EURO|nr:putative phenylalanyl-tRNA synthetase alpha subunit [Aspergillus costaricaensis CBS 115574]RAK85885.1 putative phenylalanyl-tRNA synthetase alpha subunit [Aspergillus costaricaensis CBS 115574]